MRKLQQATAINDANEGEWTQVGERDQWTRGTKEQTIAQKGSGHKDGQNGSKESEREQHQHEQERKLQKALSSNDNKREWTNGGGPDNDGMSSYKVKTGVIEVRFMKSGDAGFNVARSLKEFIAAARESDNEFSIIPLSKEGNNICRAADVPNTKDGIGN
jgi:hypothetical protein